MPLDISKYMERCSETVRPEEFQAVFEFGHASKTSPTTGVSSLSIDQATVNIVVPENQPSIEIADKIFNVFVLRFGFPCRLHRDQGKKIENELFKQLQKHCGVIHSRMTPYHPEGNGQVDWVYRTLLSMLSTLPKKI